MKHMMDSISDSDKEIYETIKKEKIITVQASIIDNRFVVFWATSCPAIFDSKTIDVIPNKVKSRYSCTLNL